MTLSALITVVIVLAILGVAEWLLVESGWVPMAQPLKVVIRVIFILFILLWLLKQFGLWSGPVFQ